MKRVMKRALADRAKLSLGPSATNSATNDNIKTSNNESYKAAEREGMVSVTSNSSNNSVVTTSTNGTFENGRSSSNGERPEQPPPLKIPRLERSTAEKSPKGSSDSSFVRTEQVTSSGATAPHSPKPGRGGNHRNSSSHKRQRREESASANSSSARSASPNPESAFYLQHQNRALAVELKSLQAKIKELTREREHRRKSCWQAVEALHSLQATWTRLEKALQPPSQSSSSKRTSQLLKEVSRSAKRPCSTVGDSEETAVEWTSALHRALRALGGSSSRIARRRPKTDVERESRGQNHSVNENGFDDESEDPNHEALAAAMKKRVMCLEEWIWQVLRSKENNHSGDRRPASPDTSSDLELERLQTLAAELGLARDEVGARERRLRRNIYRFEAGMMTQAQLIRSAMENYTTENSGSGEAPNCISSGPNHGGDDPERIAVQKDAALQAVHSQPMPVTSSTGTGSGDHDSVRAEAPTSGDAASSPNDQLPHMNGVKGVDLSKLTEEVEDAKQQIANRDKFIEEYTGKIRELQDRINHLSLKQQSDEDRKKLEMYETTLSKLQAAEKELAAIKVKVDKRTEQLAEALGNEDEMRRALDDLQSKHQRRWTELTAGEEAAQENGEVTLSEEQARKIAELNHKLLQALENVRQAETVRSNLKNALSMNDTLKSNLADLKAKYAAATERGDKTERGERGERSERTERSEKSGRSSNHDDHRHHHHHTSSNSKGESNTSSSNHRESAAERSSSSNHRESAAERSSSSNHRESAAERSSSSNHRESVAERFSAEKVEKMYRENKKMRKEMSAMSASRDNYKGKIEKMEKERSGMMDSNARLLKQISEKDEMNAKSLASILHLKSLTEQLTVERDNLEQQAKSAEQLALAARLATNAKERVSDEILREKSVLESKVNELEESQCTMQAKLAEKVEECTSISAATVTLKSDLKKMQTRCDELVGELDDRGDEIRKLVDSLDKRSKEAEQSAGSSRFTGKIEAEGSTFTTEQLNLQISVLKNRLRCPVCHYRDKDCIIMRCRHMHCKQCVEERLNNRIRKCPTCNLQFGKTDVEDIFLG